MEKSVGRRKQNKNKENKSKQRKQKQMKQEQRRENIEKKAKKVKSLIVFIHFYNPPLGIFFMAIAAQQHKKKKLRDY